MKGDGLKFGVPPSGGSRLRRKARLKAVLQTFSLLIDLLWNSINTIAVCLILYGGTAIPIYSATGPQRAAGPQRRQSAGSIQSLRDAVRRNPHSAEAHNALGLAL